MELGKKVLVKDLVAELLKQDQEAEIEILVSTRTTKNLYLKVTKSLVWEVIASKAPSKKTVRIYSSLPETDTHYSMVSEKKKK